MNKQSFRKQMVAGASLLAFAFGIRLQGDSAKIVNLMTGSKAFVDAKDVRPGTFRKITVNDLPKPYATSSNRNTQLATRP